MDERDYKAMNDELKKEQPSIELQISDEQLDKIKSCEVLKINGMEFISRAKTTEMLIKFANEQLKEKEEEIDKLKMSLSASERFRIEDASESIDDKNILHARLMDCKSQLTKSNEMPSDEDITKKCLEISGCRDDENHAHDCPCGAMTEIAEWMRDKLTEYQNSKK